MKPVIRSLTLKGFRSFDSARIELDNPTFLVGQNGAGKSNLVDALAFLGEAMASPLHPIMTRRGGISTLCHRSTSSNGLPHFGMALELAIPSEEISSAHYGFEIQLLPHRGFLVKQEQCVITGAAGRVYFDRSEDPAHGSISSSSFTNLIPMTDSGSLVLPLVGGHKAFMPVVQALSAVRAYSIKPGRLRQPQDPDGTTSLRSDGSNSATVLQSIINESPDDFELINEFLSNLLPYKAEVRSKEIEDKLMLEFVGDLGSQKLTLGALSMSDGALRALGLLLAVFQKPAPSLIVLEEPDSTIHPGALGTILDLIKIASHRSQVVVTTHSPELLDASNWIEDRHLRIVYWEDGASHIARIGKASRETLQEHLMGAGELLRSNVLDTPPLHRHDSDYSLFEARA